ncbi:MAG: DNA polymerase I [Deltaproteobacteria bacterium]|nr:DNA polymerase I [Deltaproteobacteria bacterium]
MEPKRLYLVDGSTYIFRAFFAIRSLSSPEGLPTNAVYGFTAMLLKLVREEKPDALAVVFDKSGRSFRNDLYAPYKAHRPAPPPDLVPQFPLVRDVTRAFNIPALEMEGYEADDIIATLATRARREGIETVIVSSDKDLMQLVGPGVRMLDTMKDVIYDEAGVLEKMGVRPEQIVDFLALLGDSVDNIPGVPGIGKKTAADLLGSYESLDGIYAHIEAMKGKRRENLETFREQAYLAQKLATVACDVPIDIAMDALTVQEPDKAALTELFSRLGFKTWHREFHDAEALDTGPRLAREGYSLVSTEAELRALAETLSKARLVAFDTETTGLDPRRSELVGLSFATDTRHAWYVPIRHQLMDASAVQLTPEAALAALDPILADPARPKAAHNAKFDIQVLRRAGVTVRGLAFDTMLASYLLDPGRYAHSLDNIALDRLNHKTVKFSDVAGSGKDQVTFDRVPLATARDYACEDAQVVMALEELFVPELEAAGLRGLLDELELPLAQVLADMEDTGVRIDSDRLHALSEELGERAQALETEAHALAGESFSLGSPKQIGHILFEVLGLPASKKTKTGWSTDSSVLEELAPVHPLPRLILDWRQATKLKSTYTDVLPTLVNPDTGRIHTSYNQAVAATGRLSSTDPNLQNIPVRTEDGQRIREAFVAAPGRVLLSADYSQIELRVLAHMAGETAMQRAFQDGADIHARTAHELFGTPEAEVTREQRSVAKTINFGILYGMSAFRLAREQNLSRTEAQAIIDRYFSRYPRIQRWKDQTLEAAQRDGQVSTMLGRIRRIPDITSKNVMARRGAERVAINTPIQGTAADIIKLAMVKLHRELPKASPDALMVLQVHDELVFEVPEAEAPKLADFVTRVMGGVVDLDVPLVVNAAWGTSWLEAH